MIHLRNSFDKHNKYNHNKGFSLVELLPLTGLIFRIILMKSRLIIP